MYKYIDRQTDSHGMREDGTTRVRERGQYSLRYAEFHSLYINYCGAFTCGSNATLHIILRTPCYYSI